MTHENTSDGSENPNPLSEKRDRSDDEDPVPFKKRVRFLSSDDLKKMTSGLTDVIEENRMDTIPKSTSTTCNQDDSSASLSQLATSEKHEEESKEMIQTGTTLSPTGSDQSSRLIQEAAVKNYRTRSTARDREDQRKEDIIYRRRKGKKRRSSSSSSSSSDKKPLEDQVQAPDQGSDTGLEIRGGRSSEDDRHEEVQIAVTEVDEMSNRNVCGCPKDEIAPHDFDFTFDVHFDVPFPGDDEEEAQEATVKDVQDGSGAPSGEEPIREDDKSEEDYFGDAFFRIQDVDDDGFSPIRTIVENNNGGNDEVDGDGEEQGKHASVENDVVRIDNPPGSEEQILEEGEIPADDYFVTPTMIHGGGGGSHSYPHTAAAGSSKGDHREQEKLPAIIIIEDDDSTENIRNSEPEVEEQRNKGKEPVEADHHEQGQQQTANEDGGTGEGNVVSGKERQDRKGKRPMEYVASSTTNPFTNQSSPDVVGDKQQQPTDHHQETNPDRNVIRQETIYPYPGSSMAGNMNPPYANSINNQYLGVFDMAYLNIIMKPRGSLNEQGENVGGGNTPRNVVSRKKRRLGVNSSTFETLSLGPPMQEANNPFRLFGVSISGEQEIEDELANTAKRCRAVGREFFNFFVPTQQAPDGIRLFGVNLTKGETVQPVARRSHIAEEQVQPVGRRNRDIGDRRRRGESSVQQQPARCGLRLLGFDI